MRTLVLSTLCLFLLAGCDQPAPDSPPKSASSTSRFGSICFFVPTLSTTENATVEDFSGSSRVMPITMGDLSCCAGEIVFMLVPVVVTV